MRPIEAILNKLDTLLGRAELQQRFLSVAQAAEYTGLSEETVRRFISAGKLQRLTPVPGRVVVDRHELERFILSSGHNRCVRGASAAAAAKHRAGVQ